MSSSLAWEGTDQVFLQWFFVGTCVNWTGAEVREEGGGERAGDFSLKISQPLRESWSDSSQFGSVQISCSVVSSLCDPKKHSTPGLPVPHQLLEFTQTHVHWVGDAIQPTHHLSSPCPAPNPSHHQSPFQWVNSSHEVYEVLELQL